MRPHRLGHHHEPGQPAPHRRPRHPDRCRDRALPEPRRLQLQRPADRGGPIAATNQHRRRQQHMRGPATPAAAPTRAHTLSSSTPPDRGAHAPTPTARERRRHTTDTTALPPTARTRRGPGQGLPSPLAAPTRSKRPSRLSTKTWPGGLRSSQDPPTLPRHDERGNLTTAPPSSPLLSLYPCIVLTLGVG